MSLKYFMPPTLKMFGIIGVALAAGRPTSGTAEQSYPWCTQYETLQCYYTTREQCEEAVNYHGFCIANPAAQNNAAAQRPYRPPRHGGHLSRE
jgi:hypothetical protein